MSKKKEPIKQPAKKVESTPAAPPAPVSAPAPVKSVEAAKPAAPAPTPTPAPAPAPAKPVEAAKPAAPAPAPAKPVEAAKPIEPAPAPAKPAAAKPAAPAKPAASAKTAKPATSAKGSAPVTIIVAKYDAGYGNDLYIRGEGAGLSWETGALMKNVENDVWVWTTNETAKGAISFKFLLNDSTDHWSLGDNLSASTGETTTTTPYF